METPAPMLYKKNRDQVIFQIEQELKDLDIGWEGRQGGPGWALVRLFGRLSELMINRLNQVPEKHFFAFLNAAGIDFVPPGAASTELTFTMAGDGPSHIRVPEGSQMATAQTETSPEIVFETTRDVVITPNILSCVISCDPTNFSDQTDRATGTVSAAYPAFSGSEQRKKIMYLGDDNLLVFSDDTQREASAVTLNFVFDPPGNPDEDGWAIAWRYYDGERWADLSASVDNHTQNFSRDGNVVFTHLPALSESEIDGKTAVWIACELTGGFSRNHLPKIRSIMGSRSILLEKKAIKADTLLSAIQSGTTHIPLDPENGFFPFGQKPSRLDAFYLNVNEAFNKTGGTLALSMDVAHAPSDMADLGGKTLSAVVSWEYYGPSGWQAIMNLTGSTGLFLSTGRGTVSFPIPEMKKNRVNDTEGYWIRARMVSGNFEIEGGMVEATVGGRKILQWSSPGLYAPVVSNLSIILDYTGVASSPLPVSEVIACTDDEFRDLSKEIAAGKSLDPFHGKADGPALYLGFGNAFPQGKWIQIRIDVDEDAASEPIDRKIAWEYFNGFSFSSLRISDGAEGFQKKGYLGFFAPEDHASGKAFGHEAYWIRAIPESSPETEAKNFTPYLKTIRINTVPAVNSVTVKDVTLGSSDGKPDQVFYLPRTPVTPGVALAVLEPDRPPDEELAGHVNELIQADASAQVFPYDSKGQSGNETWVRWIQTSGFFASGASSRHFTVDPVSGKVTFGNGIRGAIPPVGRNNIKAVSFKTHNGSAGNVDSNTITVVRNPSGDLENIKSVTNVEAPVGGCDVETLDEIKLRGPQRLKHRQRSVTWEDYEWLAREASSEVLHARCFPVTDPLGRTVAGHVAVVITPDSRDKKPYPGTALIRSVRAYLEKHALANLKKDSALFVTGPSYIECSVKASVVPVAPEKSDQVELNILRRLEAFLNPLTGGPDGNGWKLGRDVFLSEISAEIEAVDGVDHLEAITLGGSLQQYALSIAPEGGTFRKAPFDIRQESQVSSFDERVKFLLAGSLSSESTNGSGEIKTLTLYGFKADDTVAIVTETNASIQANLKILSVSDNRILFDAPFEAPSQWELRDALISADERLRSPLSATGDVILDALGKVAGVVIGGFSPGDKVCVVDGIRRDPALEFIPVESVSIVDNRIFVPGNCLVYSGTHDIDMIIGD